MQSERLFKEAPVWQAIGALVGPSVLSVLVMIIYNMTDLFFIGLLQDTALTAAVAVVGPVFTLASAGATVLGMGGCAVVAGSLGAGDRQDARCVSSLCGWCGLLTGVLLAVVLNLFCEPILYLLGTNAEILPYATHYLRILALGAPAMIFSVSASHPAAGRRRHPPGTGGQPGRKPYQYPAGPAFHPGLRLEHCRSCRSHHAGQSGGQRALPSPHSLPF